MEQIQIIIIFVLALCAGRFYLKYKQEKRKFDINQQCKRDFLTMYKSILTDVSTLKNRNKELNELFNKIEK